MTSADRPGDPAICNHAWQPVSMVFETQLLDEYGRVRVRQPDTEAGRVYLVCLQCASHTYQETRWIGHRLYGSKDEPQVSQDEDCPHDHTDLFKAHGERGPYQKCLRCGERLPSDFRVDQEKERLDDAVCAHTRVKQFPNTTGLDGPSWAECLDCHETVVNG